MATFDVCKPWISRPSRDCCSMEVIPAILWNTQHNHTAHNQFQLAVFLSICTNCRFFYSSATFLLLIVTVVSYIASVSTCLKYGSVMSIMLILWKIMLGYYVISVKGSAIYPLLHPWAHRYTRLDSVTVIDRWECMPALPPREYSQFCSLGSQLQISVASPTTRWDLSFFNTFSKSNCWQIAEV